MINNPNAVSVIIPAYNEEKHIQKAVECIVQQDWPGTIEMIIVDGGSTDQTVPILHDLKPGLPENRLLKLLHNPERHIPISLNLACRNAAFDIIVRMDAHTYAPPYYISETVRALKEINFRGITGGRIDIQPGDRTSLAEAIAIAVSHPLGVGNALYRTLKADVQDLIEADTVPFAAFPKALWQELGGYDEQLLYDEDYDFNYRVKQAGYRVVLNPKIVLRYFARKDLAMLWKQYYRYGYWANRFILKHKIIPSLRRFVPAGFVLFLALLAIISRKAFLGLLLVYLLPVLAISIQEGLIKRRKMSLTFFLLPTFPVLHFSYGIGSLVSLLTGIKKRRFRKLSQKR